MNKCPWCNGEVKLEGVTGFHAQVKCQRCHSRSIFRISQEQIQKAGNASKAAEEQWDRMTSSPTPNVYPKKDVSATFYNFGTMTIYCE